MWGDTMRLSNLAHASCWAHHSSHNSTTGLYPPGSALLHGYLNGLQCTDGYDLVRPFELHVQNPDQVTLFWLIALLLGRSRILLQLGRHLMLLSHDSGYISAIFSIHSWAAFLASIL